MKILRQSRTTEEVEEYLDLEDTPDIMDMGLNELSIGED
jgi:hypothetical protein